MIKKKKCSKCKQVKPLDDFHNQNGVKDGKRSHCKICYNKQRKMYYNSGGREQRGHVSKYNKMCSLIIKNKS